MSMPRKLALAAEIVWTYGLVRALLLRRDVPAAIVRLRRTGRTELTSLPDRPAALRLGRAVGRTLALLPADNRCLMQSLVLTRLLARRGIASEVVIGVAAAPTFASHAWVEADGLPVLAPAAEPFHRLVTL